MIKIGIVMRRLLDEVVNKCNDMLESGENINIDIIGFIQNVSLSNEVPNFALMNISEAYLYDGLLIATDLDSAEKMLTFLGTKKKVFYVSDLEWVGQTQRTFAELMNIYNNPKLTLIASTQEIAIDIENLWNNKVASVVADFDVGEISNAYLQLLS